MDDVRWETLVRKLESRARAHPVAYRRRVMLLALVGYAFILGFIALLVAVAAAAVVAGIHGGGLLALKVLVVLGGLVWVVVRSLHVSFEPPGGVAITSADAPELFEMLRSVQRLIRAPRLHRVLLDDRVNAGVVQIPRAAGLLGSQNYLVLGLPYLLALTPDELRAVTAHELGHLSRRHGRFGSFVYRVRATWWQLLEALEERRSIWTGAMRRFFVWYVPYFSAYALPVARAHEFEADDAAAEVAGREAAAAGLASSLLAGRWMEEAYWPDVFRAADTQATPTAAFAPLSGRIDEARSYGNVEAAFRALVAEETDITSSHPSLGERFSHLGVEPEVALAAATASVRPSAAVVLGPSLPRFVEAVESHWRTQVTREWRDAHLEARTARRRLEELNRATALAPEDELERAGLTERFEGEDAALPAYHGLVGGPQGAYACFSVGRILLERGDDEGLRWLDRAIAAGPETALTGSTLAIGYLREHGRDDEAERYEELARQGFESFVKASEERRSIDVDDELEPSGLPDAVLADIRSKVSSQEEILEAYLLRKRLTLPDDANPFFVLAYVLKGGFRAGWRRSRAEERGREPIDDALGRSIEIPGELMVGRIYRGTEIGQRVTSVEGGLIFRRDETRPRTG